MRLEPFGEILSKQIRISNGFKLWVQEQIRAWAGDQPEDKDNPEFHYFLNVKRLRNGNKRPQFECDLQLLTHDHILTSIRGGASPRRAFRYCLNSLHEAA
ncbi:MAG: hypothetical protein NDJ90_07210 [Oligoflexia bacterium]|nr:hypothetical protein [Oligoflexia bacterium]